MSKHEDWEDDRIKVIGHISKALSVDEFQAQKLINDYAQRCEEVEGGVLLPDGIFRPENFQISHEDCAKDILKQTIHSVYHYCPLQIFDATGPYQPKIEFKTRYGILTKTGVAVKLEDEAKIVNQKLVKYLFS